MKKAIRSAKVKRAVKGILGAVRKPKRDMRIEHLHTLAKATFNCVADIHASLCDVLTLREELAIERAFCKLYKGQVADLEAQVAALQRSQGEIPATSWNRDTRSWQLLP